MVLVRHYDDKNTYTASGFVLSKCCLNANYGRCDASASYRNEPKRQFSFTSQFGRLGLTSYHVRHNNDNNDKSEKVNKINSEPLTQ